MATSDSASWVRGDNSPYRFRASDIIGMNVKNMSDDTIGVVDDLIITGGDEVALAVISVGGFLGIGDKLVSVPYNELQMGGEDNDYVVYNSTKDALKAQPEFEYNKGERLGREIGMTRYQSTDTMAADTVTATKPAADVAAMETKDAADSGVWDQIAGNWKQFKGHVKQQWGELTDDELDVIEGKRDVLVGKIQERYGVSKQEAEQQVDDWAHTL
jgi:uncharacterized protein YjbJ (UPF0337 family)